MKILKTIHNCKTLEIRKGDLPLVDQAQYECRLEDVAMIKTYDHTKEIEFESGDYLGIGLNFEHNGEIYIVIEQEQDLESGLSTYKAIHYKPIT